MWKTLHLDKAETNAQPKFEMKLGSADPKDTAFSSSSDATNNVHVKWDDNPESC